MSTPARIRRDNFFAPIGAPSKHQRHHSRRFGVCCAKILRDVRHTWRRLFGSTQGKFKAWEAGRNGLSGLPSKIWREQMLDLSQVLRQWIYLIFVFLRHSQASRIIAWPFKWINSYCTGSSSRVRNESECGCTTSRCIRRYSFVLVQKCGNSLEKRNVPLFLNEAWKDSMIALS